MSYFKGRYTIMDLSGNENISMKKFLYCHIETKITVQHSKESYSRADLSGNIKILILSYS